VSVLHIATSRLPTTFGTFAMHGFADSESGKEHIALTMGELQAQTDVLVRMHSECLTGDALFSMRCDCGSQLHEALKRIADQGQGALLYLRQEGRGIGLLNKIKAYNLQDQGADTVEANEKLGFSADERGYEMAKAMLDYLGIQSVRLMTNNPRKVNALTNLGIIVMKREAIQVGKNSHNDAYLQINYKPGSVI
jgi:GTP cyclohydrolase II